MKENPNVSCWLVPFGRAKLRMGVLQSIAEFDTLVKIGLYVLVFILEKLCPGSARVSLWKVGRQFQNGLPRVPKTIKDS